MAMTGADTYSSEKIFLGQSEKKTEQIAIYSTEMGYSFLSMGLVYDGE